MADCHLSDLISCWVCGSARNIYRGSTQPIASATQALFVARHSEMVVFLAGLIHKEDTSSTGSAVSEVSARAGPSRLPSARGDRPSHRIVAFLQFINGNACLLERVKGNRHGSGPCSEGPSGLYWSPFGDGIPIRPRPKIRRK